MRALVAVACCLALAGSPLALAQDKGKSAAESGGAGAKPDAASEQKGALKDRAQACTRQAQEKKMMKAEDHKKFMESCMNN